MARQYEVIYGGGWMNKWKYKVIYGGLMFYNK